VKTEGFKNLRYQAGRYAVLGIIANAAGFLLYYSLVQAAGLKPAVSISIVYFCVCACNYFGNKLWTFQDHSRVSKSAPKYFIAQGIGYASNLGIMSILNGRLGLPHAYVQLFAITVVALLLFLLSKYIVFRSG
jgi:putative flippase GtrA